MAINIDVFKKSYLVVGLSDEDIQKLAALATIQEFKTGQEIVSLGTREADVFIVISGVAKVERKGGAILGTCGVGSVIGEIALLDNQPRSATVIARGGPVVCTRIDGPTLRRFIFQHKDIGFVIVTNIARILAMRLREASISIEDLRGQVSDLWLYKDKT